MFASRNMRVARLAEGVAARAASTTSVVGAQSKNAANSLIAQRKKTVLGVWLATMPSSPPSLKKRWNSAALYGDSRRSSEWQWWSRMGMVERLRDIVLNDECKMTNDKCRMQMTND